VSAPNVISIGRLLAVPLAVWLIVTDRMQLAFWVFVCAGVSDGLDGFIAKRFNRRTVLGAYLDPLADKALLVAVYVALGYARHLPDWLVILVVFRDLAIIGGALLLYMLGQSLKVAPLMISKFNTFAQVLLAAVVLAEIGFGLPGQLYSNLLVYVVGATTLISGIAYLVEGGRRAARLERG
jgi:cardiolipin synthase (CMP-forming)